MKNRAAQILYSWISQGPGKIPLDLRVSAVDYLPRWGSPLPDRGSMVHHGAGWGKSWANFLCSGGSLLLLKHPQKWRQLPDRQLWPPVSPKMTTASGTRMGSAATKNGVDRWVSRVLLASVAFYGGTGVILLRTSTPQAL